MLQTAEIRWFLPEPDLASFASLFPKSPPGDSMNWQETRTDVYRVVPGANIIGLKVRGNGGLELKALRATPEPFPWKPSSTSVVSEIVLGRTDLWVKWDLPEANGEKLLPGAREIPVKKVRWTRKFSADGTHLKPVRAHPPPSFPNDGCNVERTELTVGQEQWLSLAFEAFGEPSRVRTILARCVGLIMEAATPPEIAQLSAARSESYPVWLDAHVRR